MRRLEASAISMQRERMLGGGVINERMNLQEGNFK